MKNKRLVFFSFFLLLCGAVFFWGMKAFYRPLAPALQSRDVPSALISTKTAIVNDLGIQLTPLPAEIFTQELPIIDELPTETSTSPEKGSVLSPSLEIPTISATKNEEEEQSIPTTTKGICNRTGVMTILVIGSDYRGKEYLYGLADVIRVVRIDFDRSSIKVLALPRDLWVRIPGLEARNIEYGKINQAYLFGTPGMGYYEGLAGGAGLMAETLYENFGVFPDHYLVVSMATVVEAIDLIGGIDITLPAPVDGNFVLPDGSSQKLGYFPAGPQHFSGEKVLRFMRVRYGYSDQKRIDNQTLVLNAAWDKIRKSRLLLGRVALYGGETILKKKVLTDFSPSDVSLFVCLARELETRDIQFVNLPSDTIQAGIIYSDIQHDNVFVFLPDLDRLRPIIQQFWNGTWP